MTSKKIFTLLIIISSFLLINPQSTISQTQNSEKLAPPENINQLKEEGEKTGKIFLQEFPRGVKNIWDKEVIPLWKKMWEGTKHLWGKYIGQQLKNLWYKYTKPLIEKTVTKTEKIAGKKIEERKPQVEKEFQKKKEETKKQIEEQTPRITKTIWEKIKEIIK